MQWLPRIPLLPAAGCIRRLSNRCGEHHIDGAGGNYTSQPDAIRCGVGVARLGEAPLELLWGLWCGLPGCTQTAPRAELYAVALVEARVACVSEVFIVTDCVPVLRGIQECQLLGVNADVDKKRRRRRKNTTIAELSRASDRPSDMDLHVSSGEPCRLVRKHGVKFHNNAPFGKDF